MLNINAIPKPYDNVRPKGFFTSRKSQIVEKLMTQSPYKTFNQNYAIKSATISRLPVEYDAAWEELKVMTPWVLFLGMAIINLLMVL